MIIALVGLPGSGKSRAARFFKEKGFTIVRLGDVTEDVLNQKELAVNEENEKKVREELRRIHGMDAYARLSMPKIKGHENVVIDGLRSLEEHMLFKKELKSYRLVHIDTQKSIRYSRLGSRRIRPLTEEECEARDERELVSLGVEKTLPHADVKLTNDGTQEEFEKKLSGLL